AGLEGVALGIRGHVGGQRPLAPGGRVEIGAAGEHEAVELGDLLVAPLVLRGEDHGAGAGCAQGAHVVLVDGDGVMTRPGAGHHGAGPRGHADERATSALRHDVVLSAEERCSGPPVDDWTQSTAPMTSRATSVAEYDTGRGGCGRSTPPGVERGGSEQGADAPVL